MRSLGRVTLVTATVASLLAVALPTATPVLGADDLATEVETITGEVETLRGIERSAPVPWRLAGAEEALADQLDQMLADVEFVTQARGEGVILERLGLLPPGTDIVELTAETLRSQVAGYYDSDTGALTVIDEDGTLDLSARLVLAHETQHALQDQRWDLDARIDAVDPAESDQALALRALIEGDATLLMTLWASKYAASDLTTDPTMAALPGAEQLAALPQVLQRQLLFPYLDGLSFLMRRWGPGGWEAVDRVWDAPPVSTEQVMHPERYPDDLPQVVALPHLAERLGDGWSVGWQTVMGELGTSAWVADGAAWDPLAFSLAGQQMPNAEAAAGWGGDRVVSLDGPDGAWAVVWQTAWDTAADAEEFTAAANAAMADLPGAHAVSAANIADGDLTEPVLVFVADGDETLAQVREGLGVP